MRAWTLRARAGLDAARASLPASARDAPLAPLACLPQETFTNLLLDAYAASSGAFPRGLDWTFGPVLFDARLAPVWLAHEGALWDAQVVPFVRAVRWHGARIGGFSVPYAHSAAMKLEEEGKVRWARKRFDQLALWARVMPGEFTAVADPDGGRVKLKLHRRPAYVSAQ